MFENLIDQEAGLCLSANVALLYVVLQRQNYLKKLFLQIAICCKKFL